jgi:hypothetical protein
VGGGIEWIERGVSPELLRLSWCLIWSNMKSGVGI